MSPKIGSGSEDQGESVLGKIGDSAVIVVAAILTICGILLAIQPWDALNIAARISMESAQQQPPQQQFHAGPGEVAIGIPPRAQDKPAKPKPKSR